MICERCEEREGTPDMFTGCVECDECADAYVEAQVWRRDMNAAEGIYPSVAPPVKMLDNRWNS